MLAKSRKFSSIGIRSFRSSDVSIQLTKNKRSHVAKEKLEFGKTPTDHMLRIEWDSVDGWDTPKIMPYQDICIDPFSSVFHYGLGCFEGMKAYRAVNGKIHLFRPRENMNRFSLSAQRLSFPDFPQEELLSLIKKLVAIDQSWIPDGRGYSLYLRPTMVGVAPLLGVKASVKVLLFVVLSPVGPYFAKGFKPVKLFADTVNVRSHLGGTGAFKLGCNYASTIQPQLEAAKLGYDQVLWLRDGLVTEVGQMNLFCLWRTKQGKVQLITAPLDGTILPGIVRLSILELVQQDKRFNTIVDEVTESYYTIAELAEAATEGRVMEIFGCGTGAVVCPVAGFGWNEKYYELQPKYDFAQKVMDAIQDIQYGTVQSDWIEEVKY